MKPFYILTALILIGFEGHSQIKIGVDTTRKYPVQPPKLKKNSDSYIGETEKNLQNKMPIKKTSGSIPNVAIDTTARIPNSMKKKN